MFNQTKVKFIPSKILAGVISLPILASISLLITHEVSLVVKALFVFLLLLCCYYYISDLALLRTRKSVTELSISPYTLQLRGCDWGPIEACIEGRSFINKYFCLLTLKHQPLLKTKRPYLPSFFSKSYILITPLNVKCTEEFRRFRVFAKLGNQTETL